MKLILSLLVVGVSFTSAVYAENYPRTPPTEQAPSDQGWPSVNSPAVSCMRMAYNHFVKIGEKPENAWNNALGACQSGLDFQCVDTAYRHWEARGKNPRTAWNNAVRDCRGLRNR
ncbi:MAG TPA: hypothetical protein VEK08_15670 [Planctomycetota bacterium]|nr:hypothetical protein [Planctomycetota bacterium]